MKARISRIPAVVASVLGAFLVLTAPTSHAQVAVIDTANLRQSVQNIVEDARRYEQLAQTISHLHNTFRSLTGIRNLAAALNNPLLQNYLPPAAYRLLNDVDKLGYGGLSQRAKALRDLAMIYNCQDMKGTAQGSCQSMLAVPYQLKAMVNDAQDRSSQRIAQIDALMQQAAATIDPKAIAEAQARIGAEIALLAHEQSQAQLASMAAQADDQVRSSRFLERQLANLARAVR